MAELLNAAQCPLDPVEIVLNAVYSPLIPVAPTLKLLFEVRRRWRRSANFCLNPGASGTGVQTFV